MKSCVILYHKNINNIYKSEWINKSIESIKRQSYNEYFVYDLNYGDDDFSFANSFSDIGEKYKFFSSRFNNHADAMNFLFDRCEEDDFDVVFNINLDDYYDSRRFEIQINKLHEGYDVVSSNMQYLRYDTPCETFYFSDHNGNIKDRLKIDNIICHPSVCFGRRFLENVRYNSDEIPYEDYFMWQRISSDFINKNLSFTSSLKVYICQEILCFYRIHKSQVSGSGDIIPESEIKRLINKKIR